MLNRPKDYLSPASRQVSSPCSPVGSAAHTPKQLTNPSRNWKRRLQSKLSRGKLFLFYCGASEAAGRPASVIMRLSDSQVTESSVKLPAFQ